MKKEILMNLRSRIESLLDNDIGSPIRQLQNEHSNKIIKFLEYRYNNSLKNIDVLIDLLKLLLSVSGSILIAKYTVANFSIKSSYVEIIFVVLFILLFTLFIIRTRISNDAINKYNTFLDIDSKSIRDYSNNYFDGLRDNLKIMNEELKTLFKKQRKK